jgi:alkanesulfonate monooxygenase SsuD/methylene tetrahydromethanopterin reductase-like flavin-dependent oxidoreductase (luciferase family)
MKFGIINVPFSLDYPAQRRTLAEVIEWDLQVTQWADECGLTDAFFAEHYTIGREPSPAPDVMIAAASQRTSRIRLGAAAHLLPYHNPISLAHRLLYLDHLTNGRYICGIAPGAFPTDAQLFNTGSNNQEMMREALEIILAIWTQEPPFRIEGKYWTVDMPAYGEYWYGPHLKPLQAPHPPLVVVGLQPESPSLREAGKRGLMPMSNGIASENLRRHWETYCAGAEEGGQTPDRADWRVARDLFVADTDEAAVDYAVNGEQGRVWRDHNLPLFKSRGITDLMLPGVPAETVTVEYLAENFWIVGSPDTVVQKLEALQAETGGFGTQILGTYGSMDDPEPVRRSFELLGQAVMPRVQNLGASEPATAR